MSSATALSAAKLSRELQALVDATIKPPSETAKSPAEPIIYMAMVRKTRPYIEALAHQINGTYANAWYDACAVMIRRLVETLIIEAYETHKIEDRIKGKDGDFLFLRDLVVKIVAEPALPLGRNSKKSLPRLKDIGDKSAHSRMFVAHREDIDKLDADLRTVVQELLFLAKLKS